MVELAETRQTAEKKRKTLQNRWERTEGPRRNHDALLQLYTGMVDEELDDLTSGERYRAYRMVARLDETLEVSGTFSSSSEVLARNQRPQIHEVHEVEHPTARRSA